MSQTPIPPPPPAEKESDRNSLFWPIVWSFVGMLATAAVVFVLMFENDTDKAATFTREAEEYLQEDNLPAAKALLEEAVELHSEDAQRLLENVNDRVRQQELAEQQRQDAEQQAEEERRLEEAAAQEADRLAAEEELRRDKETEEERLRETIRKEFELARKTEEDKKPKNSEPLSLPDLLQQVFPSVVIIKADNSQGSGFVVGSNLICTSHHVINGAGSVKVAFKNGATREAQGTQFKSESMDIAILKVMDVPVRITALDLHPRDPRQGEKVYAIGAPMGLNETVTDGIVSKVHSEKSSRNNLGMSGTWIQTNAEINSGNSGGPLINSLGKVVGMSTLGSGAFRDKQGNIQVVTNINFATSVTNIAKAIELAKSGRLTDFEANPAPVNKNQVAGGPPQYKSYTKYYENGEKHVEGHYKDGKPDGLWTAWDENGRKIMEAHYKDDERVYK